MSRKAIYTHTICVGAFARLMHINTWLFSLVFLLLPTSLQAMDRLSGKRAVTISVSNLVGRLDATHA